MSYDPTIYAGSASHYARGRPGYSHGLAATLVGELGLDGSGRLLDVGCGPGTLALLLAAHFEEAVGLDPDAGMLSEAGREAGRRGTRKVRWILARAEDLPAAARGPFKLVTFGQSFHWTDRERVAETVYDLLDPNGAIVLVEHEAAGRPRPVGPGYPLMPHDAILAAIDRFLGPRRRAGQGYSSRPPDRHEDALARTRFGPPRIVFCEGRDDIVRDIDGVLSRYLSTSFAAPHLFADRLDEFTLAVRTELARVSPRGLFWDWPGDTALLIARKNRCSEVPPPEARGL